MKRSCIIRLIGMVAGESSELDGQYVAAYDPTYHPLGQPYAGGILEVTDDPRKALRFPDALAATEKWRQSYGLRPDGKPNRPLTAWTVELEEAP